MKNTIILILSLLVIGLGSYVIFDKFINKEKKSEYSQCDEKENIEDSVISSDNGSEDNEKANDAEIKQFDQYLSVFLDWFIQFDKNLSNKDISQFLYHYYANSYRTIPDEIFDDNYTGTFTYTVSKKELDKVVYNYFGKREYHIVEGNQRGGIKKVDDNTYEIHWFATGYYTPNHKFIKKYEEGEFLVVEYETSSEFLVNANGILKIYLSKLKNGYSNFGYIVSKIEFIES